MNKSAFLKLIQQVSNISDQQTEELEKVASTFPYCQTAHLLLAKSAYDKGSMLSTQRLRRASSYATDRQLLKRVIYTSLTPEPEFVEAEVTAVEEEAVVVPASEAVSEGIEATTAIESTEVTEGITEDAPLDLAPEEETLEEVYTTGLTSEHEITENSTDAATAEDEAKLDSELALLFTFNSISSSSTDLFSSRPYVEEEDEEAPQPAADFYEPEQEAEEASVETEAVALEEDAATLEEEPFFEEDGEPEAVPAPVGAETADVAPVAEEDAGDAEIIYTLDEIDRLYAEDALGYWMGSSRMGEVLQLKDDYTRQRPQSFHPELILEYSKTHELEKAIQPGKNVLSQQLDIIDQFLKLNPRLKTMANMKLKPEPQEDLSLKSSKIKKGMASENLANIFLKQGKTKKALKIYEQLILKYPEKKSYFAEQIEKLQNLT